MLSDKTAKTLVMKFGGTSVGSTEGMSQVVKIATTERPNWDNLVVVASAFSGITDLLLNVFFPGAVSAAPKFWETYRELPAANSNQRVELAAGRLFGSTALARRLGKRAMTQQGLLQIYDDFCIACDTDCARCAMPSRLDHWGEQGYG